MSEERKDLHKKQQVLLRVDDEHKNQLELLSQKYGISQSAIITYLIDLTVKYQLLEPNWKENIINESLQEYKAKLEEQFNAKIEQEKMRWKLRFKHDLLMKYVDALEPQERKEFIQDIMLDLKDPLFLEKIGEMELTIIDGKRKLVKIKNGKPFIPNIPQDQIIECEKGYHIKGNYCTCEKWKECQIRLEEYAKQQAETKLKKIGLM